MKSRHSFSVSDNGLALILTLAAALASSSFSWVVHFIGTAEELEDAGLA